MAEKDDMLEKLSAKYLRNRKVWEENERKASEEIKKLDEMFDHVIETLKALPESQRNSEPIQDLLHLLAIDTREQTINGTTNGPIDGPKKLTNGLTDQVNGQTETNQTNANNEKK